MFLEGAMCLAKLSVFLFWLRLRRALEESKALAGRLGMG